MGGRCLPLALVTVLFLGLAFDHVTCRCNSKGKVFKGRRLRRSPVVCKPAKKDTFADITCSGSSKILEVQVEESIQEPVPCRGRQLDQLMQGQRCQGRGRCSVSLQPNLLITSDVTSCIGLPAKTVALSANCTRKGVNIFEFERTKTKTISEAKGVMQTPDYPWLSQIKTPLVVTFNSSQGRQSRYLHFTFRKVALAENMTLTLTPTRGQRRLVDSGQWLSGSLPRPGDVTLTLTPDPQGASVEGYRLCFMWNRRKKLKKTNDVCRHLTETPKKIAIRGSGRKKVKKTPKQSA